MSQLNLQVISHNIANAGTPGYSRQRAEMIPSPPHALPSVNFRPGYVQQLGSGVNVEAVKRIRDEFLDQVINIQTGAQGRNSTVDVAYASLELLFGEPGERSLGTIIDEYFTAWQELSNNPELVSTRANLREQAISLTRTVTTLDASLKRLASEQVTQLKYQIESLNSIARQVADLNMQIAQVKSLGDDPNDLMDRRDLLIEQIAELVPTTTIEQITHTTSVLIGGLRLVEDEFVHEIELVMNPRDHDDFIVQFKNGNVPDLIGQGTLAGLLEARREIIPFFQDRLNTLTTGLINRVNVQHRRGFGLDGGFGRPFFSDYRTATMQSTFDLPATTTKDTTLDQLAITAGDFTIQGKRVTITYEDIAPGEAISLGTLLDRITDSQPYVRASLRTGLSGNPQIRLDLYNPKENGELINIFSGTSNFLEIVGLETATSTLLDADETYTNSTHMFELSLAIMEDLDVIAAAGDDGSGNYTGPGNNENALAISALQYLNTAIEETTFGDFYSSTISELGSQAQTAQRLVSNQGVLLNQLYVRRESIRGVNMDEEATAMIVYQRIYEGAARVTQVVDSMLDTLINRTGV